MNPNRDTDRKFRAWLDLMPDEAPDRAITAVHQAVEATPQLRRPLIPALRRFSSMNRAIYAAAAAVTIAVVAGGALLLKPGGNTGGPPSPSPTGTAPTQSTTPALVPESLRATWIAQAGPAPTPGSPAPLLRLIISAAGGQASVVDAGAPSFVSNVAATQTGEIAFTSSDTTGGCQIGDLGRYGFALGADGAVTGSDGTTLALTLVADTCAARSAALNRAWVHAIDAPSTGGRGISTAFAPKFLVTLPRADYSPQNTTDWVTITSATPDRTLIVVKNPVGWADPCSSTGGAKLPVAPTIKAFTAYLRTLPGFTVNSADLQIDGRPAAHLTIPSVQTADCPGNRVNEWSGVADVSGGWHLSQGETDVLTLIEVNGDLILVQWLGNGVTSEEELALLATLHFTDTLPQ